MRLFAAALLALSVSAAAARADEESWDARVVSVKGDVVVRPADGSEEAAAGEDMPLEEGDHIVVPEGGSAEISLDGGSLITLAEGSDFTIEKAAKADSTFFLSMGSLLAKIQKLGDARLRVRTPTAVAAVRGTDFGVEVEGEGDAAQSHVGVFDEGKVEVTGQAGGEPETLISNQETSVKRGAAPLRARQLQRFIRRRAAMRAHARRLAAIRARWKPLARAQRLERRRELLEKLRERRRERLKKLKAMKEKAGRGRGRRGPDPEWLKRDREKRERFRESIRRRRP